MRFSIPKYIAFGLLLAFAGMAVAQTSSGTIAGVVSDPTDAVVVDATVTAKSADTGATVSATTNARGAYRLEGLLPGIYVVTVASKGFVTARIQDVDVRASIVTSVNPTLRLGASDTVSVEAQAVPLATESGEMSASIGAKEIQSLPISNLNPYDLALTLPGVSSVEGAKMTQGSAMSVNGSRPRANNYLIEGQDNNDPGIHGQAMMPNNLEATNEVAVLTNSYTAEFGHGGGAVSNLVFKTGSNAFHGSVWDRHLNSALDAVDHQDKLLGNTQVPKFRENYFGFALGGPVKQDKMFFFVSYQWDRRRGDVTAAQMKLPTEAGYEFLQSLGNPRVDAYLQSIGSMRGISDPQDIQISNDPVTDAERFVEFGKTKRTGLSDFINGGELDATGDYLINKSDTLHLRYIRNSQNVPYDSVNYPEQLPGFDITNFGVAHNAGISETHTFNQAVINEFRISFNRIGFTFTQRPETLQNPLANGPSISIDGITGYGVDTGVPQGRYQNNYQYQDSVSIAKGNHFIKLGFDVTDTRVRDVIPFNPRGSISYDQTPGVASGLANFIDDYSGPYPASVSRTFGSPVSHAGLGSQNYFAQDNWKVLSNLTLNLGLRYEYWGTPANQLAYPAFDINDPGCFPCRVKQQPDRTNWAPRAGFAYTPRFWQGLFGDGKTVINGGFGIFYDGLFTNITNNTASSSPNVATPTTYGPMDTESRGTPGWSQVFANLPTTPTAFSTVNSMVSDLKSPRTMQWNLRVQRELPQNLLASIGYVGSLGQRLYGNTEFNSTDSLTGERRIPTRGRIILRDNSGDSEYHALNAELDRKLSKGLLARISYTWSKMMDDTSEVFTDGNWSSYPVVQYPSNRRTTDWARSPFDHTHRLVISYVYDIPNWKTGERVYLPLKMLVNGWQISGRSTFQSGTPMNVFTGYDINGDGISNDRPNLGNPSAPVNTYGVDGGFWFDRPGTVCDGWYWWNTNDDCHQVSPNSVHWVVPGLGVTGNVPRNTLTSPGIQNWDFTIQRTFSITEKQKLDFRAEIFNVFNHSIPDLYYQKLSLVDDIGKPGSGIPDFANWNLTNSGNREIKFYLKYSF